MSESSGADLDNGPTGLPIVVSIPNQPVQVQSVIQSNQPSVIQTAGAGNVQTIQVVRVAAVEDDLSADEADTKKRREILARRPSYRKILKDLSSPVSKMDDESNSSQSQDGQDGDGAQNLSSSAGGVHYQHTGATIVQYTQGPDGQFYIPGISVSGSNVQAYQIATSGSLPQGVVMATTGSPIGTPNSVVSEETSRKRELRLLKNREAARECRRKKKEYVKCLENRVAVLENQNKTLIEELKTLKELYCQKEG